MIRAAAVLMAVLFHADHVLPGDAPAITDGAVLVSDEGRIEDVGRASDLLPRHAGAAIARVHGVVTPGLVNAHTHIELSALHAKIPGGRGFVPWVEGLIGTRSEAAPEDDTAAIEAAVDDLVRSGTVAVGEVTNSLAAVPVLAKRGIAGCVFHEVFGQERASVMRRVEGLRADLESREWPSRELAYAPAPHTLYTTHPDAVRALLEGAARYDLRTSLHLAEHAGERRAIEHGDGPVPEWLWTRARQRPEWPKVPLFDYAASLGALSPRVILVHLTDARPDELARVGGSGAPVVLCPRSNRHIEGRTPPVRGVLAAGIEAALGTDSLASNASLDVLEEARALEGVPDLTRVRMMTWNGARALGRSDLGRIAKGARPGLVAFEGDAKGDPAGFVLGANAPRKMLTEIRS